MNILFIIYIFALFVITSPKLIFKISNININGSYSIESSCIICMEAVLSDL